MLVLTRGENQSIRLDGPGTITIVRCSGSSVRVGIDAPPTTKIVRSELPPLTDDPRPDTERGAA